MLPRLFSQLHVENHFTLLGVDFPGNLMSAEVFPPGDEENHTGRVAGMELWTGHQAHNLVDRNE
jgi:hypothetical protein